VRNARNSNKIRCLALLVHAYAASIVTHVVRDVTLIDELEHTSPPLFPRNRHGLPGGELVAIVRLRIQGPFTQPAHTIHSHSKTCDKWLELKWLRIITHNELRVQVPETVALQSRGT
jgi:hypothetical protein